MMCVPAEPTVNEVIDPMQVIENYKRENKHLREELALHDKLINRNGVSYEPLNDQQLHEIENQCRRFVDGSLDDIEVQNLRQLQGKLRSHFGLHSIDAFLLFFFKLFSILFEIFAGELTRHNETLFIQNLDVLVRMERVMIDEHVIILIQLNDRFTINEKFVVLLVKEENKFENLFISEFGFELCRCKQWHWK